MNVTHHQTTESPSSSKKQSTAGQYMLWFIRCGIICAIILAIIYLSLLNALATQGFALQEIKADRLLIQKELEKWEIAVSNPVSLYALQSSEQVQNMEEVKEKEYIHIQQGQLAMQQP